MLVLAVIWWAWQFTTWATNELDPEALEVRLMLLGVMFASLLMSIAIPEAFGERGPCFSRGLTSAIQVGAPDLSHLLRPPPAARSSAPERRGS